MLKVTGRLATVVSLSMALGVSSASAATVMPGHEMIDRTVNRIGDRTGVVLSEYTPPDDVESPSSSQGSGTR